MLKTLGSRLLLLTATVLASFITLQDGLSACGRDNPQPRPFKAVGTAVWDNLYAGFTPGGASFQGAGVGTHLGKFQQVGKLFFTGPPDENGIIPGLGNVILTAANGDQLKFNYVGGLDSSTGIGSGTLTFTGGSGRFAKASGSGTFYAVINISTGPENAPMKVTLNGQVVY